MRYILSSLLTLSLFISTTALAKASTKKPSRGPASTARCPDLPSPTLTANDRLRGPVTLTLPVIEKYAELLAKWGNHSLYCLPATASCEELTAYQLQHQRWGELDRKARRFQSYEMVSSQPALVINGRQIQGEIAAHRDDFDSVSTRAFNQASLAFIQRRDGVRSPAGVLTTQGAGTEAACAAEAAEIARYRNKNTSELLDFINEEISRPPEVQTPAAAVEPPEPTGFGPAEDQDQD